MSKTILNKFLILLILVLVGFGGYSIYKLRNSATSGNVNSNTSQNNVNPQSASNDEEYDDLGISFKHPERYVVERSGSFINLMEKEIYDRIQAGEGPFQNAYVMGFTIYNNDADKGLNEWLDIYLSQNNLLNIEREMTEVAGEEAIYFVIEGEDTSDNVYVLKHPENNKIIFFYYLENFENDAEYILDTLEFV